MKWSYGITTVPARVWSGLPKTIMSLKRAGFDEPRLFVDGPMPIIPRWFREYKVTHHEEVVHAYGNWILALHEMLILSPHCDRYAIFQDDIQCCSHLKEYLERCVYPTHSYLNLVTYPSQEPLLPSHGHWGWYRSSQLGKGAQGLVFDNEAAVMLCTSSMFIRRMLDLSPRPSDGKPKGQSNIDGGVSCAMKDIGFTEFVHRPSLITHIISEPSAIGNAQQPVIGTWPGEDYNPLPLLDGVIR